MMKERKENVNKEQNIKIVSDKMMNDKKMGKRKWNETKDSEKQRRICMYREKGRITRKSIDRGKP